MDFLTQLKEIIAQDKETANLQINDKDVILVYDYLQNRKKVNQLGQRLVLETKPFLHTVLKPTIKTKELEYYKSLEQQNAFFSDIVNFQNCTLLQLKINESEKKRLSNDLQTILHLDQMDKGFYLWGPFETGKTFFLKAIANLLMQHQKVFIFVLMADLMRKFKISSWYNDLLEIQLNKLKNISYLFLDDLGSEKMTSAFRDDIFFPLLNYRLEKKKPIFITSNLDIKSLIKYFKLEQEFNAEIKAVKIVDRISKLTYSYNFSHRYEL